MRSVAIVDDAGVMTGIGSFLRSLLGALLGSGSATGWKLILVVPDEDLAGRPVVWPEPLEAAGLRVVRIPSAARDDVSGWLDSWLERGEADVAYLVSPDRLRPLRSPIPLVATFHDFNYRRFVTLPLAFRQRLEQDLPTWVARCAVCVVSSRFIASELVSYFPGALARVRVVRLGVPAAPPADPGAWSRLLEKQKLPERFALTVGWLAPHKNQAPLFEATAVLRARGVDLPLVCVGPNTRQLRPSVTATDPYVRELLDLAAARGLRYGVDYWGAGSVDDAELAALYARAAVLVVPSLYEAGSFPLREAARAGCPIVSAAVPPLVEDDELLDRAALLFDPDDADSIAEAIERVIADPEATQLRVRRARSAVAQAFDWTRTAAGYIAAFEAARARVA